MRSGTPLVLALLLGACSESAAPPSAEVPRGAPNLLLVTIDTCRADRLGCYGHERPTSPAVDHLARGGVRFARAFACAPLTLPSHTSILTGQLPSTHGARTNWEPVPDEGVHTLAEELGGAGWQTAAVVGGFVLNRRFGLAQGFEHYDDDFDASYREATEVLAGVRRWVALRDPARPYFLWVHFMDVHGPYTPPPAALAELGLEPPRDVAALESARRAAILEDRVPSAEEVEGLMRLYDGEVRHVDAVLARMMVELEQGGLLRDTYVVLTADHGEGFGHGYFFDHGDRLWDEELHVPLLLAGPGLPRGAVVEELVRSVDLLPTVLELLGRPAPAGGAGTSLLPLVRGEDEEPRLAWAETYLRRAKSYGEHERLAPDERSAGTLFALRSLRFKLIRTELEGGDASTRAFDVERDPLEGAPLPPGDVPAGLARALEGYARAAGPIRGEVDPELAPDELEKLRALGYADDGD